ncbi:MAG: hypothetical protein CME64_10665 [Halobacteriovoraceae bacterium]|nr:hypothetical protein [Halobacteriovoraceae bacterium]
MEKGFNDDELADIMNEIESLEKEFAHDDKAEEAETVEMQAPEETENVETQVAEEVESIEPHAEQQEVQEPVAEEVVAEEVSAAHEEEEPLKEMAPIQEVKEEMQEVLGELSDMPVEDIVPTAVDHAEHDENVHHIKERETVSHNHQNQAKGHTAMSFHVEGDMKFELSFHISGKFVGLTVTEEGLEIGLDGGAKFTIPVEHGAEQKKAS